jgi:uncharacterized protein (DUF1810 family)
MAQLGDAAGREDPFNLRRFTSAQHGVYGRALAELKKGEKRSHWMWFIFPQVDGLGCSTTTKHYAIKSVEEARQYLGHPVLGPRLVECTEAVLAIEGRAAFEIFAPPDDMKLRSSMTLFASVAEAPSVFGRVLDKYFEGGPDAKTLHALEKLKDKKDKKDNTRF